MIKRLALVLALPVLLTMASCAPGSQGATTLAMAKQWVASISAALVAGSQAYTGPRAAEVQQYAAQLQQAAGVFQQSGDVTTARTAALSVLQAGQQLLPLLVDASGRPLLGAVNAGYVAMGLAVAQAFISALPPPPETPPEPPASLARATVRQ